MPISSFYHQIFFTNILRVLDERRMTQEELAERSGVSTSFISDLANGRANPSLRTMEAIAVALETPLPTLLESTDLDREALNELAGGKALQSLPQGYQRISAILTDYQAFLVEEWDEVNRKRLREQASPKKKATVR
ncbi:transcriptional regulator, XRE family [Nitrosospira multiformis]|jgi:transcriptional regulator with XRE-family HTH domain|uniref:Transcriptional regulator, XRE family n=1 Tax=Nitrosospira multiformis TaxID=1231 RepID=A0A1H8N6T9_9PROT|nr:transcriptional regulator [Nitrosospira multiformis]SEO25327.1 transcriptional regulator, XRE family [Nitrosospira multiformis]